MAAATASASTHGIPRAVPPGGEAAPRVNKIVAVDFGTSGSAYCFSARPFDGFADIPSHVLSELNVHVVGAAGGSETFSKAATAVLLNKTTLDVMSVGATAQSTYSRLLDDSEDEPNAILVEYFKMHMSPEKRGATSPLQVALRFPGRRDPVLLMIPVAKYLAAIREDALKRMVMTGAVVAGAQVGWVLTVPAIWDDAAKAFMRAAAVEAGMVVAVNSPLLSLALEPECAALAAMLSSPPEMMEGFAKDQVMVVCDLGGGTVDCTVSVITRARPLETRELMPASGGPWGGRCVDDALLACLEDIFGAATMERLDADAQRKLRQDWENAKRTFSVAAAEADKEKFRIEVPAIEDALGGPDELRARADAFNTKQRLTEATGQVKRTKKQPTLILPPPVVRGIFDKAVDRIISHLGTLVADVGRQPEPVHRRINTLVLAGGFAESPYLQDRVKARFGASMRIVLPERPQQLIVRGAALFGLFPDAFITARRSRYTYAVKVTERWNPALHGRYEATHKVAINGKLGCRNVLRPLIMHGEELLPGHSVPYTFKADGGPVQPGATELDVVVRLYCLPVPLAPWTDRDHRTCVLDDGAAAPAGLRAVHESDWRARIVVQVAAHKGIPLADRGATLTLECGRSNLVIKAVSPVTKATLQQAVKYD